MRDPADLESDDVLGRAAGWCREGRAVAVATVAATWGSAPRPVGSLLAVNDAGEFAGSVSGGCVETAVIEEARRVIAEGGLRRLRFGVTQERAWEVGLACGGEIEILVERANPELLEQTLRALRAKRSVALATDVATGEQWLFDPEAAAPSGAADGGSGVSVAIADALRSGRPGPVAAGDRALFVNVFHPPARLVLVGAVHIAQALARVAALSGFEVIIVDPRETFAARERFPGVSIVREWPDEALRSLSLDARSAVVTLSHDPKVDEPALAVAVRSAAFYVGALGSRKTHAKRVERLRELGLADDEIARVHAPVGLAIGARTPAEIAISILAEVVGELRRRG